MDKMKKNKKSQAEIVGLVIIVLLITIGILFIVKFVVLKENPNTKIDFVHSELASNMINVMLKTTVTDCKRSSVTELFKDCAAVQSHIDCDDDGIPDSCEKVNETIKIILDESLVKWRNQYEFRAYKPSYKEHPLSSYGKCIKRGNVASATYPIPIDMGTLFVRLDICS